jgi:hypothetical protein
LKKVKFVNRIIFSELPSIDVIIAPSEGYRIAIDPIGITWPFKPQETVISEWLFVTLLFMFCHFIRFKNRIFFYKANFGGDLFTKNEKNVKGYCNLLLKENR